MRQTKALQIRKFNPGAFQSDTEIVMQFAVRDGELQTVLNILHDNIEAPSCQHTLLLGPCGQGKTMLLARTAAELRSNERFSEDLLPVRFMEESMEIFNMADFWLETLFHLARECMHLDSQLGKELHSRHSSLSQKWRNDSLEDLARNTVLDVADQLDRKLVLMIENLQSLFEDVDENFGWNLRKTLQTEPQIILIGSATSRFKELDNAKLPFFEFFWVIDLKPLNTAECQKLWAMVNGQNISEREIRPLEILTGGSPRLLMIIVGFTQYKSVHRLMEELVILIDEHTDYLRGNLEALAKTERRVFLAVIDLWQPSTPSEISIRARMDIRKVSTMLGRLVSRGAVIIEGHGRKRKYVAAERLYSIYYKLRRSRDEASVVQNLIRFINAFYTGVEQVKMFAVLIDEMDDSMAIREGFDRIMASDQEIAKKLVRVYAIRHLHRIASRESRQLKEAIVESFDRGDFAKVIQKVNQALPSQSSNVFQLEDSSISQMLLLKAATHQKQGDMESALLTVSEIITRGSSVKNPEPHLRHPVAGALIIQCEILQVQGNVESALLMIEKIVTDFGDEKAPYLQGCVATALVIKGEILLNQNDLNSALDAFEEAVRRLDEVENQQFRWLIARALTHKGRILRVQEQAASALSTFEEIIERFRASDDTELQNIVSQSLINKGRLLQTQGQLEPALSAFQEVIEQFTSAETSTLQIMVSFAFMYKIKVLCTTNEPISDETFSVIEEGIEFINSVGNTELSPAMRLLLQINLAAILITKGDALQSQNKIGPAKIAFEEVVQRFGTSDNSELKIWSITAFIGLAELQTSEGNTQDALLMYNEITERLGEIDTPHKAGLTWEAFRVCTQIRLAQGDLSAAVDSFRSLYAILDPNDEAMIWVISDFVISFIGIGVSPHTLLEILSGDSARKEVLKPIIVALKQEAGETVRAPRELLEVVSDIRKDIQVRRSSLIPQGEK